MQSITRSELISLARQRDGGPCVSIFLPTHRAGPQTRQDPIRLKNLLTEAAGELGDEHGGILDPAWELLDESEFWRHQSDGLALLLSSSGMRTYRVPLRFEECQQVADRFRITPLTPLMSRDARYHVLALSRGSVRLLECTAEGARRLEGGSLPASLEDAVGHDWEERSIQQRTVTPTGDARRNDAMFHGQGVSREDSDSETIRFLEHVDRGIRDLVDDNTTPLVLATVDDLAGEFRKRSRYSGLVESWVPGNPDDMDPDELRRAAWPLVQEILRRPVRAAAERFGDLHGTGRATSEPETVVLAASEGRVETLFAARGAAVRGTVDAEQRAVAIADDGDEELVDRAVVETLAHDGTVFVVASDQMPGGAGSMGAILRY